MTNTWADIKNADVILVMGGNAAEAHPVGFKWVIEAKAHNRARLIVVDPRFNRTASVADLYAPIRVGTDIAFLNGVIRYLLERDALQHEYVRAYTNAPFIVREEFGFDDGLFTGYDAATRHYDKSTWQYELDADGQARIDPTLAHPRCVLNLLKAHVARYTPEVVSALTGTPLDLFQQVAELIASTAAPDRVLTSLYALGWTQHSVGAQNIRTLAIIQLLLGNIGLPGGGVNALRGHSNIQGLTDLGLLSDLLPGYMAMPVDADTSRAVYLEKHTPKALRPGQVNYWANYPKFHTSLMKAWFGPAATAENDFCYDWLPKLDQVYDGLRAFDRMASGATTGYFCQGFNPLASFPDKAKIARALSRLKFLVVMDPLATETAEFWQDHGEFNEADPAAIQTEVFRLPTTCFAEEEGSLVNSSRWLQWHWKAAEPPGECRTDVEIMTGLFMRMRELYRQEGGVFPEPVLGLHWPYRDPEAPAPDEIAREYNGQALVDLADPKDPSRILVKAGQQLSSFAQLRDDGSTASGTWIFCGAWTEAGNQMARRETADPSGLGLAPEWAWAWPLNRRILYNRASCDPAGRPWNPHRKLIEWDGQRWSGYDVPDFKLDAGPDSEVSPFIMTDEGVGRLFARDMMAEGPFPEHYEPFETPLADNPLHSRVISNPAARVFEQDRAMLGNRSAFPHVATTYRLTEHFHFWTKHSAINASLQPQQFVEIGAALAAELGIANGEWVRVSSKRGHIIAVAMVTKRIRALTVAGQTVHQVGIPIHWGFTGATRKGYIANTLTPFLGDANTQTPEFKAFLVKVEKSAAPASPVAAVREQDETTAATTKTSWLTRVLKGRTEV